MDDCAAVQPMGIGAMGLRGHLGGHLGGALALVLCLAGPVFAETGNGVGTQFELTFWQSVTGSDDPALYEAYLQQYPTGTFSALAKAKVANLRKVADSADVGPVEPVASLPEALPLAQVSVAVTRGNSAPVAPVASAAALSAKMVRLASDTAQMTQEALPVSDDTALLEELAKSQEVAGATLQGAVAQGFALPMRPALSAVPELPLPSVFCSAEQRNAFHETRYKPVMEIARANNAAAVAHMQRLQQVYDSLQLARDPTPMNAVAREASDYQPVAAQAYNKQIAMVQQFQAIMAVPVTACQMAAAQ